MLLNDGHFQPMQSDVGKQGRDDSTLRVPAVVGNNLPFSITQLSARLGSLVEGLGLLEFVQEGTMVDLVEALGDIGV